MRRRNPARWRAIESRLGRDQTIWLATVRHDGRPHLAPLWFIWLEGMLYICTPPDTQKYANLIHSQMVSLALPDPDKVIIIEGEAHVADRQTVEFLADQFYYKYEWDFRYDEDNYRLIEITPHKILAWGDGYDAEGIRIL
ncbi:MAG: hypothetical protein GY796_03035 [Chloroflexi bacterium]|nr:hypothetical protein [Chloroflexota bacterium]